MVDQSEFFSPQELYSVRTLVREFKPASGDLNYLHLQLVFRCFNAHPVLSKSLLTWMPVLRNNCYTCQHLSPPRCYTLTQAVVKLQITPSTGSMRRRTNNLHGPSNQPISDPSYPQPRKYPPITALYVTNRPHQQRPSCNLLRPSL